MSGNEAHIVYLCPPPLRDSEEGYIAPEDIAESRLSDGSHCRDDVCKLGPICIAAHSWPSWLSWTLQATVLPKLTNYRDASAPRYKVSPREPPHLDVTRKKVGCDGKTVLLFGGSLALNFSAHSCNRSVACILLL